MKKEPPKIDKMSNIDKEIEEKKQETNDKKNKMNKKPEFDEITQFYRNKLLDIEINTDKI